MAVSSMLPKIVGWVVIVVEHWPGARGLRHVGRVVMVIRRWPSGHDS